MIIPALYARQRDRGGYLTDTDLRDVADQLAVPLYRVQSLVSFFPHFRQSPPPAGRGPHLSRHELSSARQPAA